MKLQNTLNCISMSYILQAVTVTVFNVEGLMFLQQKKESPQREVCYKVFVEDDGEMLPRDK